MSSGNLQHRVYIREFAVRYQVKVHGLESEIQFENVDFIVFISVNIVVYPVSGEREREERRERESFSNRGCACLVVPAVVRDFLLVYDAVSCEVIQRIDVFQLLQRGFENLDIVSLL